MKSRPRVRPSKATRFIIGDRVEFSSVMKKVANPGTGVTYEEVALPTAHGWRKNNSLEWERTTRDINAGVIVGKRSINEYEVNPRAIDVPAVRPIKGESRVGWLVAYSLSRTPVLVLDSRIKLLSSTEPLPVLEARASGEKVNRKDSGEPARLNGVEPSRVSLVTNVRNFGKTSAMVDQILETATERGILLEVIGPHFTDGSLKKAHREGVAEGWVAARAAMHERRTNPRGAGINDHRYVERIKANERINTLKSILDDIESKSSPLELGPEHVELIKKWINGSIADELRKVK